MRKRTTRFNVAVLTEGPILVEEWEEDDDDLFEDEEVDSPSSEEETAFDDVAMILLLFFMVTSLLVVISPEPESPNQGQVPYTTERADPAKLFKGVSHRLLIAPHRAGGVQLMLSSVGPSADDRSLVRGPFLSNGSADVDLEYDAFRAAFKELLGDDKVPPAAGEGTPKPVYLVNHFPHNVDNDVVLTTWYALAALAKDESLQPYTSKVRFTRWRAQVRE